MKAFVSTVGEPTTELCIWSLERNGFDVEVVAGGSLLVDKLKTIYETADEDFVRVDADVVPNRNLTKDILLSAMTDHPDAWWLQFRTFDWLQQDLAYGGVQFIKKEALPILRENVDKVHERDRPETALSRLPEFYEPRRFESNKYIVGIHGFALGEHLGRVQNQKKKRKYYESFDFELAKKLEELI